MDFNDTPEEAAFRAEARAFLQANAQKKGASRPTLRLGGMVGEEVTRCKTWQAKKADAGFAGITWQKRFGGRELPPVFQVIYNQEEEDFTVPRGLFEIGLGMCIPTMMTYAKPEQLDRFVKPAVRGEEVWCQLFSEPAGGSDLAALRTRAERDGDDWIINGQKIWTSGAHLSDFGIIVVRTDPNVPKHEGLTFFFLDMKSPGIDIRPIHQMSGTRHFNEVFFTDVRVPDSQRLGHVGQGWRVSLTTLMNERLAVGDPARPDVEDLVSLARSVMLNGQPAIRDQAVRERIAEWYAQAQGLKFTKFRTMTALSKGETPGPENSIHKLVNASKLQNIASYGMDLMGEAGMVIDDGMVEAWGMFQSALLSSPSARIAGGSDEILKNIIAERVLGLPADIRVDKNRAFNTVPTGNR